MENLVQTAVQNVNLAAIYPPMILAGLAMVLLMLNVFLPRGSSRAAYYYSIAAVIVTAFFTVTPWGSAIEGFGGHVLLDNFATFFNGIFLLVALFTILMSEEYNQREGFRVGEYYALIMFATVGAMFMASATDMLTLFLGLEVMSIALYVLAGFFRNQLRSNEAGLKYFLLGAFSTGFLLYGIALIYGVTGTTNMHSIAAYFQDAPHMVQNPLTVAGMLLFATGLLFKIAVVPFHMWTPDVYEGAPTPITAFMSAGPKAAAFAALVRGLVLALGDLNLEWSWLLWVLAVVTMFIGNIMALTQTNLKRMLAYSSIAHAGYALVGLVAANAIGISGILFYMAAYAFMNIGAFAILVIAGKVGEENLTLEGFSGMGFKRPMLGVALTIFLISLMGIPPTAGFAGKFYIFAGAVEAGYVWLAVLGVLNSALSLYYYLRVMVYMYFRPSEEDFSWVKLHIGPALTVVISVIGVLYLGMLPGGLMDMARQALF